MATHPEWPLGVSCHLGKQQRGSPRLLPARTGSGSVSVRGGLGQLSPRPTFMRHLLCARWCRSQTPWPLPSGHRGRPVPQVRALGGRHSLTKAGVFEEVWGCCGPGWDGQWCKRRPGAMGCAGDRRMGPARWAFGGLPRDQRGLGRGREEAHPGRGVRPPRDEPVSPLNPSPSRVPALSPTPGNILRPMAPSAGHVEHRPGAWRSAQEGGGVN